MSTDQSTELIWHFIGYLHMEELLSKLPIYYSGAYIVQDSDLLPRDDQFADRFPKTDGFAFDKIKKIDFSDDIALPDDVFQPPRLGDVPVALSARELIQLAHEKAPVATPKSFIPGPDDVTQKIHVSYTFGGNQHQWLEIDQRNFLSNNDLLLSGANEGITEAHNIDAEAVLSGMLEAAREVFADLNLNPLEQSPEQIAAIMRREAGQIWADAESEWKKYVKETGDTDTPMPYPGKILQGKFVNGEFIADGTAQDGEDDTAQDSTGMDGDNSSSSADGTAQVTATSDSENSNGVSEMVDHVHGQADIAAVDDAAHASEAGGQETGDADEDAGGSTHDAAATDGYGPEGTDNYEPDQAVAEEAHGEEVHITTNAGEPTGGAAQIATLGGNDATNSALISDFSDGYGSIIVMGDVYATNAIYQVNVLHDNDLIDLDEDAVLDFANSGNNSTDNIAAFQFDTQTLVGNPAFGNLAVGLNWNVDYIDGNFYDVKIITQFNSLFDNDINEQSTTNTHFVSSLGENSQTDIAQILDYGKDYDLIIVAGDVYELNIIAQINLLLDDDIVTLNSNGEPGNTEFADTGQNVLLNDASIINVGGGEYDELTDEAEELGELIGDKETEIDPELAENLPGNGSNDINVLYITGDFYDLKAIYQLNIMADVDLSEQSMEEDGQYVALDGEGAEFEQQVETGGNLETNSAVIIDVDSTSDYQYLGGNYYQNDVLVQANIIEEDELVFDNEEGLIETTIALLEDQAGDGDNLNVSDDDLPDNVADGDILGTLLG